MANALDRMLANIGASNIREQQREERMSSNILAQAFQREDRRVTQATNVLGELQKQITTLSDPKEVDKITSGAKSIANQVDSPVVEAIMNGLQNTADLKKKNINIEKASNTLKNNYVQQIKKAGGNETELAELITIASTLPNTELREDITKNINATIEATKNLKTAYQTENLSKSFKDLRGKISSYIVNNDREGLRNYLEDDPTFLLYNRDKKIDDEELGITLSNVSASVFKGDQKEFDQQLATTLGEIAKRQPTKKDTYKGVPDLASFANQKTDIIDDFSKSMSAELKLFNSKAKDALKMDGSSPTFKNLVSFDVGELTTPGAVERQLKNVSDHILGLIDVGKSKSNVVVNIIPSIKKESIHWEDYQTADDKINKTDYIKMTGSEDGYTEGMTWADEQVVNARYINFNGRQILNPEFVKKIITDITEPKETKKDNPNYESDLLTKQKGFGKAMFEAHSRADEDKDSQGTRDKTVTYFEMTDYLMKISDYYVQQVSQASEILNMNNEIDQTNETINNLNTQYNFTSDVFTTTLDSTQAPVDTTTQK
tara:strand:+ start:23565 stop:25202 length:1638 start_codon:yes stop_codon:yes gene_type:complete